MVLGIIVLVLQVISMISGGFTVGTLIGLALGILYVVGAVMNKNSLQQPVQ